MDDNTISDDAFKFDAAMVGAIVEEHGYRLTPLKATPLQTMVDVCILMVVLLLLIQVKMHVDSLIRKRKRKLQ